jgi:DNA-directed RNA polymerase subunit K/omega
MNIINYKIEHKNNNIYKGIMDISKENDKNTKIEIVDNGEINNEEENDEDDEDEEDEEDDEDDEEEEDDDGYDEGDEGDEGDDEGDGGDDEGDGDINSNNINNNRKKHTDNEVISKHDIFNSEIYNSYVDRNYPELKDINFNEMISLTKIIRNKRGNIIDLNHTTLPFMTKFERTKIIGLRTTQLNNGADSLINLDILNIIDSSIIAEKELNARQLPFIISRPLPNGVREFWNINDLEFII